MGNTNHKVKTVMQKLLEKIFLRFFCQMDRTRSLKGVQFKSKLIKELCKLLLVKKTHTTPYYPQGGELVERINQTILNTLATMVKDHKSLGVTIKNNIMACNSSIQSITGQSRFFLMFLWIHNFLENVLP